MSCGVSDLIPSEPETIELANATHTPQIFYEDSSRSCGFNLIDANHSRVYANYKDVEVWCKEPGSVLQSLQYESLGRGSETATRAHIQNIEGMLYDHVAEEVYSDGKWIMPRNNEFYPIPNAPGVLFLHQPLNETEDYAFVQLVRSYKGYPGYSIVTDKGYHGSTDAFYSASLYFKGKMITNFDYAVQSFDFKEVYQEYKELEGRVIDPGSTFVYGFYEFDGKLIYGGTEKSSDSPNSILGIYDGQKVTKFDLPTNQPEIRHAGEYYSYLRLGDELYIGTYPSGYIVTYNATDGFQLTDKPEWDPNDSFGSFYRELQSSTLIKGVPIAGMYPWGELYEELGGDWKLVPFVPEVRSTGDVVPFDFSYRERFKLSDDEFRGEKLLDRLDDMLESLPASNRVTKSDSTPPLSAIRYEGIGTTSWGLRIGNMAVFSGKFCLATGNMQGVVYDPMIHDWIPPEVAAKYDKVFCANLPGHILISKSQAKGSSASIENKKIVVRDGDTIVKTVDW